MPDEEFLRDQFLDPKNEWKYIPFKNEYCTINTFDNENDNYKIYENKWIIFGRWRGKLALYNLNDPSIIIKSINLWKVNNTIEIKEDFIE